MSRVVDAQVGGPDRQDDPTAGPVGRRIAQDSAALVLTSVLTAGVGLLFWVVAARTIPPAQLGLDAALISAVTAAATVAATGAANAFLASVPTSGRHRAALVRFGYLVVAVAAVITGGLAGTAVVSLLSRGFPWWPTVPLIAGCTVVWSMFILQDPVLAATGRARWLLVENLPVNVVKLALLPVFGLGLGLAHAALFAMITPALLAVLVVSGLVVPRLARSGDGRVGTDWPTERRRTAAFIARDGTGSALNLGLFMALPFLVTATAGPEQGALFILCLQVSAGLDLVTGGIAQSLTTNVAAVPARAAAMAWRVWRRTIALVGAAFVVLAALSSVVLAVFGRDYAAGTGPQVLLVLALGSLLRTLFEVWTALMRAWHATTRLLLANVAGAVVLVPAVVLGARRDGALGAAVGVVIATVLTAAIGLVGLLRARTARR